ncbi:MAG: hypothetical protein ACJ72D_29640 [Marmoricola sp.]
MRWEESVFALFDDLEMQAEGLASEERVGQVASLADASFAEVTLPSRLHAALGADLRVGLVSGPDVRGRLTRVGAGWLLLDASGAEWLVRLDAVTYLDGAGHGSVPEDLWSMTARLSVRSVLRRIASDRRPVVLHLVGGGQVSGSLGRVGADFLELRTATGELAVLLARVAAVRPS